MDRDNKLIFEAFDNSRQNAQLEKQIKMLVNNALRATFAAIETLEGVDSLPYSGEIDALTVNLDEEVGRLMDMLEEKMPKQHSVESEEVPGSNSGIKEASLTTGNIPGQTQYNPYNVSPALKAAGQDYVNSMQSVGQGIRTAGKVLTNPAAASAAFGSWVQTDNIDSAKAAFKQKEGEQALDKIIQLSGIPNTNDNRQKIHDAVANVVFSIIGPSTKTTTPQPTMGATPAIPRPPAGLARPPTTPSKIAVRPK